MRQHTFGLFTLALVIGVSACDRSTSSTYQPQTALSVTASIPASAIGIPECDDYLARYEKCLAGNIDASARPVLEQNLSQTRSSWKTLAATEQGKSSLAQVCRTASASTKGLAQQFGCADF